VDWAGFADTYFARIMIPLRKEGVTEDEEVTNNTLFQRLNIQPVEIAPGATQNLKYKIYIGPKQYDLLRDYGDNLGKNLDKAVEFGMLWFFVSPLLVILKAFHSIPPHNWGIAILLLTLLVRVVFYPLMAKQYTSMKAMQALQPKMKELREKYKDDKDKLNVEMMSLYKVHKVNPLGGCLPMVIQLPVFFALYRVLYVAIELRHAPLFLWINDLSAPETLFIIPAFGGVHFGIGPLLMGVTMFVQQKMTPQTADPAQAKMFMFMPLIFTALSFGFPSGLVLYWTFSNLLGILQQWLLTKKQA